MNHICTSGTSITFSNNKVIKKYCLKNIKDCYKEQVYNQILNYCNKLSSIGIQIPKLLSHNNNLEFVFDFCGKNIIELMEKNPLSFFNSNISLFEEILNIIKTAKENGIFLDPHIKNFTVSNGDVFYVDIFPPYSKDYLKLLLKSDLSNKKEIIKNMDLFSPKNLGNHFIADLKKTFKKEDELINLISNKVVQLGIMDNINKNHINEIINIEELRSNDEDFELF